MSYKSVIETCSAIPKKVPVITHVIEKSSPLFFGIHLGNDLPWNLASLNAVSMYWLSSFVFSENAFLISTINRLLMCHWILSKDCWIHERFKVWDKFSSCTLEAEGPHFLEKICFVIRILFLFWKELFFLTCQAVIDSPVENGKLISTFHEKVFCIIENLPVWRNVFLSSKIWWLK